MKQINVTALFLAIMVVLMFCLVGVAIYYQNIFFGILFLLLGFTIMGIGLVIKRKRGV